MEDGNADAGKGAWVDLFRGDRALYSALVIGGIALHATQILVIAIILPTIVADIGGAVYYAWAAMLYTIGAIVGAASTGPMWARFGARRSYVLGAVAFAAGTMVCALAPNIGVLIAARGIQGWAGGLIAGSGTALVTTLFDASLRTRILAIAQGTFTVAHLSGPVVGGAFAAVGWWRGSFWVMIPFMLLFAMIAWRKVPERMERGGETGEAPPFPIRRLMMLGLGVCSVASIGPINNPFAQVGLVVLAVVLVTLTFRIDRVSQNKLFPRQALSVHAPVGLALWILSLHGMAFTSVLLFMPLLLQVVHGVSPIFISVATIMFSMGWTFGAFTVSGWTGAYERWGLRAGPTVSWLALLALTLVAKDHGLAMLVIAATFMGLGIGIYNVHLVARTMDSASKEEQRTTAAGLTSIRMIGTAFGAAIGGVIVHAAGLGDATDPDRVAHAVTMVYTLCLIPIGIAALMMFRFVQLSFAGASRS